NQNQLVSVGRFFAIRRAARGRESRARFSPNRFTAESGFAFFADEPAAAIVKIFLEEPSWITDSLLLLPSQLRCGRSPRSGRARSKPMKISGATFTARTRCRGKQRDLSLDHLAQSKGQGQLPRLGHPARARARFYRPLSGLAL